MIRSLCALLCGASLLAIPASARVVLVGVDGASWSVIDPLLAAGKLPSLAEMARRGTTAEVETVEPLNSPTVWTSIATGRSPDAHGVTDFMKTAVSIQVTTIFERLAVQGRRVGTYDYLVTWPPRPLPGGFVVPGWLRRDQSVSPAGVFENAHTAGGEPLYTVDVIDMVERPAGSERPRFGRLRQWVVRLVMRRFYQVRLDPNAHAYLLVRPTTEAFEAAWPEAMVEIAGATLPVSEIVSADGFSGRHHPIGILLAAGAPIRHLAERQRVSVLEVAPLFAYLAGAAIPQDLEGSLLEPWIRAEYLAAHPAHRVGAADLPRLPAWDDPGASGDDSDLIERLRSMGYIE